MTRRVKRSEVIDGTHVRKRAIASEKGDRVCWMKVDQHERHDVDARTHVLKILHMSTEGTASQRRTEHGHRKITLCSCIDFTMKPSLCTCLLVSSISSRFSALWYALASQPLRSTQLS